VSDPPSPDDIATSHHLRTKNNWFFYSHLSHHSQKNKQNKERTKKSPTRHVWSTIILCNFQSCCYFRFRFGRCIVWGKISNYWFISFFGRKTFFTWNQVDPALWNGGFPESFFWQKQNWTKLVGYHFSMKNIFYVKSGWSFFMKLGFPGIFFGKKSKTKTIGNSTPCTELRCWNAM